MHILSFLDEIVVIIIGNTISSADLVLRMKPQYRQIAFGMIGSLTDVWKQHGSSIQRIGNLKKIRISKSSFQEPKY